MLKHFLQDIFHRHDSKKFTFANDFLVIVTFFSILGIVLESVYVNHPYEKIFLWTEIMSVSIFTLEYIGRIIAADNKKAYILSFFGLMDLLSIVPSYFGFANFTFLKSARVLRILRFLRIIRLAKITRLEDIKHDLEDYAHLYRLNIKIYFFALFASVIIFGTAIYGVEGDREIFRHIPLGMLWAAKSILGGLHYQSAHTVAGEMVFIFARFVGVILFGLLLHVMGTTIKKLLFGSTTLGPELLEEKEK